MLDSDCETYDPKRDYCGPGQTFWTRWIPRSIFGVSINECCYAHDEAYDKGGTIHDRARADMEFRDSIEEVLSDPWWFPGWLATWISRRYYVAVKIFGSGDFNYKEKTNDHSR